MKSAFRENQRYEKFSTRGRYVRCSNLKLRYYGFRFLWASLIYRVAYFYPFYRTRNVINYFLKIFIKSKKKTKKNIGLWCLGQTLPLPVTLTLLFFIFKPFFSTVFFFPIISLPFFFSFSFHLQSELRYFKRNLFFFFK